MRKNSPIKGVLCSGFTYSHTPYVHMHVHTCACMRAHHTHTHTHTCSLLSVLSLFLVRAVTVPGAHSFK